MIIIIKYYVKLMFIIMKVVFNFSILSFPAALQNWLVLHSSILIFHSGIL